ncbi:MAG: hypothetical protein ACR2NY_01700 [Alphaproteobacteria bacterium]
MKTFLTSLAITIMLVAFASVATAEPTNSVLKRKKEWQSMQWQGFYSNKRQP